MNTIKLYNIPIINFFFCFFPISFVLGNQIINLNIILLILCGIIFYPKNILQLKLNFFDKLLILIFFYIIITLFVNYFEHKIQTNQLSEIIIFKSIFFFRYLLLYLSIRFFIDKKIINIKLFNIVCACSAIIISIDIFIQFFLGKNLIGIVPFSSRHYSSFFGKELIAGGYLQKFSLFIFFLPIILKTKYFNKILLQIFFLIFTLLAIILTGNRMPLILFLISYFAFLILDKHNRKHLLNFFVIVLFLMVIVFNKYPNFVINMTNFYNNGKILISSFFDSNLISNPSSSVWQRPYVNEFQCGKEMIKMNPIFGGGLRSYRTMASNCNSHPHNYFFEIISDLGLIGLILILIFAYKLLFLCLKDILKFGSNHSRIRIIIPFFLIFLMEFFPFRTTGSFFTTNNATVIFLVAAVIVSLSAKNNKKNNY